MKMGLDGSKKVYAIVPAFNEAENLPRLLDQLAPALERLGVPWRLVVIDDGSWDGSPFVARALARDYPVELITQPYNRGPGAAFKAGFDWVLSRADEDDALLTLEADTTSDVSILPEMWARFQDGADVVLASPYHPEGGVGDLAWTRRVLSRVANAGLRYVFDLEHIHTLSSFFRFYRASLLRRAVVVYGDDLMKEPGFAAVVELLIHLGKMNAAIEEVPMYLEPSRRRGESRMKVLRTVHAYLRMSLRLLGEEFIPRASA